MEAASLSFIEKDEVKFCRRRNARRYTASIDRHGQIRVTIPGGGSRREALQFVLENSGWLRDQQKNREEQVDKANLRHAGETVDDADGTTHVLHSNIGVFVNESV